MNQRQFSSPIQSRLILLWAVLSISFALSSQTPSFAADAANEPAENVLEYETQSAFSRIRIRKQGTIRSMIFVKDNGAEAYESVIDLAQAHILQFDYLRFFATSFLLQPNQKSVLIVGLGGGGMIHYLRHLDPRMQIDVVEIDPVVVRLADEYFNVRPGAGINIITGDGLKFFSETDRKYDVIYMDAFLKPSADTDATGAPLRLRTHQFYRTMQKKLNPGGLVVFNLNVHAGIEGDVRNIKETFPQTYVFPILNEYVVLGSTDATRVTKFELERRAQELDRQINSPSKSFRQMSQRLRQ